MTATDRDRVFAAGTLADGTRWEIITACGCNASTRHLYGPCPGGQRVTARQHHVVLEPPHSARLVLTADYPRAQVKLRALVEAQTRWAAVPMAVEAVRVEVVADDASAPLDRHAPT